MRHQYAVYGVFHPTSMELVYIGVTRHIKSRSRSHMRGASANPALSEWTRALLDDGLVPFVEVLCELNARMWPDLSDPMRFARETERQFIRAACRCGFKLFNVYGTEGVRVVECHEPGWKFAMGVTSPVREACAAGAENAD